MKIKLQSPLRQIFITQPFGENYVDFYTKLGLKGHNGIDYAVNDDILCFASNGGLITWAGTGKDGGIGCIIFNRDNQFKTIYYHLKSLKVKTGDWVEVGDEIGRCDNTGQYTTGDHLHLGLKRTDELGNTIDYQNGYKGAIDPKPFFNKYYSDAPVISGYGDVNIGFNPRRKWMKEIHARAYLTGLWKRKAKWIEIMAYVYGGWTPADIHNPLFTFNWMYHKKGDKLDFNIRYKVI